MDCSTSDTDPCPDLILLRTAAGLNDALDNVVPKTVLARLGANHVDIHNAGEGGVPHSALWGTTARSRNCACSLFFIRTKSMCDSADADPVKLAHKQSADISGRMLLLDRPPDGASSCRPNKVVRRHTPTRMRSPASSMI